MSRLYLRIHLALVGSLIAFAAIAAVLWHLRGEAPAHPHSPGAVLGVLLLLAIAVGSVAYPLVRYLVRRLERLQKGAEALAAGDLSARVEVEGNDEVARLAASFNRAAARIEQLVGAHRMLLAQASHELRTPLTRIRLALDLAGDIDPRRKRGLEADIAELDHLIEEILLASRLDTLTGLERDETLDLLALAAEECARFGVDVEGEPTEIRGDPRLLRRLVRNLVGNAERHGRAPIHVRVSARSGIAELIVADAGAEIPETERVRLFEPFYRQGNTDGHGLGLSLVRQIARRHGGDVRYGRTDSLGTGFVVTLPVRGEDAHPAGAE
jgi:signal transduction histidine kinase